MNRRALLLAPLGVAAAGAAGVGVLLERHYVPSALPSMLIGKRPPRFRLPAQPPGPAFSSADLAAPPRPMLVNFFASWCIPCVEEAAMLLRLRQQGMQIWGIAYKDQPADAAAFLAENGNPYVRLDSDLAGTVAINWGVYGVPETYLIDRSGIVRWRWAGALTGQVVASRLNPLLRRYA
ncbi:MAG: DsbE family thiol:disulfide interchange protein [Acetobacteraceae bacterium]